jgi:hypothetical protein
MPPCHYFLTLSSSDCSFTLVVVGVSHHGEPDTRSDKTLPNSLPTLTACILLLGRISWLWKATSGNTTEPSLRSFLRQITVTDAVTKRQSWRSTTLSIKLPRILSMITASSHNLIRHREMKRGTRVHGLRTTFCNFVLPSFPFELSIRKVCGS